jgi:hypothetical protein
MSLEKKEVRVWISPEAHEALGAVADLNEKEPGQYAAILLERALLGDFHSAKLLVDRITRIGRSRNLPDSTGRPRDATDKAHSTRKS